MPPLGSVRGRHRFTQFHDVDAHLVHEDRDLDVLLRMQGWRKEYTEWGTPNEDWREIEQVLPHVRLVSDSGGTEVKLALIDLDGSAVMTWDLDGTEESREVTGAYGVPLVGAPTSWASGQQWEVDGLHGQEEDREQEVMHFGTRHAMFGDGRWLQPEPMLALNASRLVGDPAMAGATYARGNAVMYLDVSGFDDQALVENSQGEDQTQNVTRLTRVAERQSGGGRNEVALLLAEPPDGGDISQAGEPIIGSARAVDLPNGNTAQALASAVGTLVGSLHTHPLNGAAAMSTADAMTLLDYGVNEANTMIISTPTEITAIQLKLPENKGLTLSIRARRRLGGMAGRSNAMAAAVLGRVAPGSTVRTMDRSSGEVTTHSPKALSTSQQSRIDRLVSQ